VYDAAYLNEFMVMEDGRARAGAKGGRIETAEEHEMSTVEIRIHFK